MSHTGSQRNAYSIQSSRPAPDSTNQMTMTPQHTPYNASQNSVSTTGPANGYPAATNPPAPYTSHQYNVNAHAAPYPYSYAPPTGPYLPTGSYPPTGPYPLTGPYPPPGAYPPTGSYPPPGPHPYGASYPPAAPYGPTTGPYMPAPPPHIAPYPNPAPHSVPPQFPNPPPHTAPYPNPAPHSVPPHQYSNPPPHAAPYPNPAPHSAPPPRVPNPPPHTAAPYPNPAPPPQVPNPAPRSVPSPRYPDPPPHSVPAPQYPNQVNTSDSHRIPSQTTTQMGYRNDRGASSKPYSRSQSGDLLSARSQRPEPGPSRSLRGVGSAQRFGKEVPGMTPSLSNQASVGSGVAGPQAALSRAPSVHLPQPSAMEGQMSGLPIATETVDDLIQIDEADRPAIDLDVAGLSAAIDEVLLQAVREKNIYGFLKDAFCDGTLPFKEEFFLAFNLSVNDAPLFIMNDIELLLKPEADIYYDEYIAHCRSSAELVWAEEIRRRESKPLELKAWVNSTLCSPGFAHTYTADDTDGPLDNFHNEKVLEMFRRIMSFFQLKIPELKMPDKPFSPASLVVPTAFLAAHLRLYLSGQRIPGPRNLAEPQTPMDRVRTVRLRQLIIRVLESDKAHILVALMDNETHSISSDLEPTLVDDEKYYSPERIAAAMAFAVPGYEPRTQAECQVLADEFHAALLQADVDREIVNASASISLRPVPPIAGPSSLVT